MCLLWIPRLSGLEVARRRLYYLVLVSCVIQKDTGNPSYCIRASGRCEAGLCQARIFSGDFYVSLIARQFLAFMELYTISKFDAEKRKVIYADPSSWSLILDACTHVLENSAKDITVAKNTSSNAWNSSRPPIQQHQPAFLNSSAPSTPSRLKHENILLKHRHTPIPSTTTIQPSIISRVPIQKLESVDKSVSPIMDFINSFQKFTQQLSNPTKTTPKSTPIRPTAVWACTSIYILPYHP
jgi:hypothetical protein